MELFLGKYIYLGGIAVLEMHWWDSFKLEWFIRIWNTWVSFHCSQLTSKWDEGRGGHGLARVALDTSSHSYPRTVDLLSANLHWSIGITSKKRQRIDYHSSYIPERDERKINPFQNQIGQQVEFQSNQFENLINGKRIQNQRHSIPSRNTQAEWKGRERGEDKTRHIYVITKQLLTSFIHIHIFIYLFFI